MSWVIITVVRPSVVQAPVVGAERVAGERIERAERLVHQHDARRRERAGDAHPLALAAGELVGKPRSRCRARSSRTRSISSSTRAVRLASSQPSRGVIAMFSADRHVRKQPDALEHVADAAAQPDRIDGAHVLAFDPHDPCAVSMSRLISRSSVVLPEPDGPTTARNWRRGTSRLRRSSTGVRSP